MSRTRAVSFRRSLRHFFGSSSLDRVTSSDRVTKSDHARPIDPVNSIDVFLGAAPEDYASATPLNGLKIFTAHMLASDVLNSLISLQAEMSDGIEPANAEAAIAAYRHALDGLTQNGPDF